MYTKERNKLNKTKSKKIAEIMIMANFRFS